MVCSHAIERQIKPLIGVDVREKKRIHEFAELLIGIFRQRLFQRSKVDNADYTTSISHQPCSQFIGAESVYRFPNRDPGLQQFARRTHGSEYLSLSSPQARLCRR